eukprot:m.1586082 g.1586082  ORF g.1586082 m.1586082 type:complete len:60 (+) comp25327_c0_seq9:4146-4325(+)
MGTDQLDPREFMAKRFKSGTAQKLSALIEVFFVDVFQLICFINALIAPLYTVGGLHLSN